MQLSLMKLNEANVKYENARREVEIVNKIK